MREIKFTLDAITPTMNTWVGMHWRARSRYMRNMAWQVREVCKPPKMPMERSVITITRYSTKLPDWDGLYGGVKPLLDCLVVRTSRNPHGLGFIRDDSPEFVLALDCWPGKVSRRKDHRTEVIIQELPEMTNFDPKDPIFIVNDKKVIKQAGAA